MLESLREPPPKPDWARVKRIHMMGIGGSAMAALAVMLKKRGFEVRGSDKGIYPPASDLLKLHEIPVQEGYLASHLDWGPDLCVVGNVMRPDYPIVLEMKRQELPGASLPECLSALFLRGKIPFVVTGTHGKTTTSSMLAWLLEQGDRPPSFFIGGMTQNHGSNHQLSEGPFFVIEGDEYDSAYWDKGSKFLHYSPYVASINNIEMDHADIFQDLGMIEATFRAFIKLLPSERKEGFHGPRLVIPRWDKRVLGLAKLSKAPLLLVGYEGDGAKDGTGENRTSQGRADLVFADELSFLPDGIHGRFAFPNGKSFRGHLPFPGEHNLMNALLAMGMAYAAGLPLPAIQKGIESFLLPLKRLSLIGRHGETLVYDDFAHHPTAIRHSLRALRQSHPEHRILALFEAQSNTARRKIFEEDFIEALKEADLVFLAAPLFKPSDPLREDQRLDFEHLERALNEKGIPTKRVLETEALPGLVIESLQGKDLVVTLSGRKLDQIGRAILARLD